MANIIEYHDVENLGTYATCRPVTEGELVVKFASPMREPNTSRFTLVVTVPGFKRLSDSWAASDDITVIVGLPEEIKGSTNRKEREELAMARAIGCTTIHLGLIYSQEVLRIVNDEIARRVKLFNEKLQDNAQRLVVSAESCYPRENYAELHARAEALADAVRKMRELLTAARDTLHAAAKADMLAALRETGAPLDFEKLEALGRERSVFIGGD